LSQAFYQWPVERQALALGKLAEEALRAYPGKFTPPKLVKYRENAIFSVQRDDGALLALRIHRPGYHSDAALASELMWMQALADQGIEVPAAAFACDGSRLILAAVAEVPEPRQIDLLQWLPGHSLGELERHRHLELGPRRAIYARAGTLAARLHDHASSWSPPSGFVRHDWHTEALVGESPLWGRFWDLKGLSTGKVELLQQAREGARRDLIDYGVRPDNAGLIHADLLADNLLVNGTAVHPIDFDDCGFGWHMFDLATILYFTIDDVDHPALSQAVMAGYRTVRPLAERDEAALPLFLLVRGMTYLGWIHTRSETATARDLAPMLVERCCRLCEAYVRRSAPFELSD